MTETPRMTFEELLEKQQGIMYEFDFEKLLDPYREGGTKEHPVRRTWGTLIVWLVDKHKFSVEIVGAAVLLVALEMRKGRKFKGDGSYGADGDQLAQYLRGICSQLRQKEQTDLVFIVIGKKIYQQIEPMIAEKVKREMKPWWKRLFGS